MKVVSLLENTTKNDYLEVEHGLSLYIEANNHKILFDMGQSDLFYKNALKLGVDLSLVDIAIISHGHYDHGGGLEKFLEINKKAFVYVHSNAFDAHYNGQIKYIGLNKIIARNPRLIFTENIKKIDTGLTLFSCNDKKRHYKFGSFGLTKKMGDSFLDDDFIHEQYLLIEEKGKRILLSGCSHKGILNILSWFMPDYLIGGLHVSKIALDDSLISLANQINNYGSTIYTCHCTGVEQYEFMKNHINNLKYLSCGDIIEI